MKIYFTASLSGREEYRQNYKEIVKILKKFGFNVYDHITETSLGEKGYWSQEETVKYYRKIRGLIQNSDILVTEVSYPSISVGYEISLALELGKPVIILYIKGKQPALFEEGISEKLEVICYDLENLEEVLKDALEDAKEQMDVRFNFFVPPRIIAYLDWIAKNKKLPRAVFLRRLIEEHIKRDKDYKS